MSRLIDVDILLKNILHQSAHEALMGHPENARGLLYAVDHMKDQPTAYDVDKVVEQIKEASYEAREWNDKTQSFNLRMIEEDEAIEIVKGGGKGE